MNMNIDARLSLANVHADLADCPFSTLAYRITHRDCLCCASPLAVHCRMSIKHSVPGNETGPLLNTCAWMSVIIYVCVSLQSVSDHVHEQVCHRLA